MKSFLKTTAALSIAGLAAIAPVAATELYPDRDEIISVHTRRYKPAAGSLKAHEKLLKSLENAGVAVELNAPICREPLPDPILASPKNGWKPASFYFSTERRVVICQESGEWTPAAQYALRIEAQHLLQDCRAAEPFDGVLAPTVTHQTTARTLINSPAKTSLTGVRVLHRRLMNREYVGLQLEAFGIAAENEPAKQRKQIERFCPTYKL